ncbi:hypothetical protein SEMRO_3493_G348600.1 [Seminavis robusta]|uniref:Uncharacterized protein n=1 Tax=Seminavis robusta TaxID=568900 RepID=A0A9N8F5N9_9STRA|nr:hypothetical protein SEMRO_3493_G348600.1 [Seminavis robusta]|eukprot:Sro3493_g348600.1 n/a (318) ;mRNA; f:5097-6050
MAKYPHMVVIDYGMSGQSQSNSVKINQLKSSVEWTQHNKTLILRGCIMGNGMHFASAAYFPYGWMVEDGQFTGPTKIKCFSLDDWRDVMSDMTISLIFYELVDNIGVGWRAGNQHFDIDSVMKYDGPKHCIDMVCTPVADATSNAAAEEDQQSDDASEQGSVPSVVEYPSTPMVSAAEIKESLLKLTSKTKSTKKKRGKRNNNKHGQRSKEKKQGVPTTMDTPSEAVTTEQKQIKDRIPTGWSFKLQQRAGTYPRCHGCNKRILHDEPRFRHKFKQEPSHTWKTVWQYHCAVKCLVSLSPEYKGELTRKRWANEQAK